MKDVSKPPGGPIGAAAITVFGALGTILDVKHAWVSISATFRGCPGLFGCTDRLLHLDDTMFNGIMVSMGILIVSVLALVVGVRSLLYHLREHEDEDVPRITSKPPKKAAPRNRRAKRKPAARKDAAAASGVGASD